MTDRPRLIPDDRHPIDISPARHRILVRAGETMIADTHRALVLREATYKPVLYIPREDADMHLLTRSDRKTYCPYKGDAGYFDLPIAGAAGSAAVWTYEAPYDAVAAIAGHLAFYPDRVTIEEVAGPE